MENRVTAVSGGASFVHDGDSNRVKKLALGEAEGTLSTEGVTTYYYLGGKMVAKRTAGTLTYIHQDSLSFTSVMSTPAGTLD